MIRERIVAPAASSGLERLHRAIREGFMPEPHASRIVNHEWKHWARLKRTRAVANFGVLEKKVLVPSWRGPVTIYANVGAFVRVENMKRILDEDPEAVAESAEAVGSEMSDADKNVSRIARGIILENKERQRRERVEHGDIYISKN